jgi:hypothetical protein
MLTSSKAVRTIWNSFSIYCLGKLLLVHSTTPGIEPQQHIHCLFLHCQNTDGFLSWNVFSVVANSFSPHTFGYTTLNLMLSPLFEISKYFFAFTFWLYLKAQRFPYKSHKYIGRNLNFWLLKALIMFHIVHHHSYFLNVLHKILVWWEIICITCSCPPSFLSKQVPPWMQVYDHNCQTLYHLRGLWLWSQVVLSETVQKQGHWALSILWVWALWNEPHVILMWWLFKLMFLQIYGLCFSISVTCNTHFCLGRSYGILRQCFIFGQGDSSPRCW